MEDFSGLENGQKFRNDADESKWAKLISAIKENSLRSVSKFILSSDTRSTDEMNFFSPFTGLNGSWKPDKVT